MYEAAHDPYRYEGTSVLINELDIRDAAGLQAFEEEITRERAAEPLPAGRFGVRHFQTVHRHLFQDVYPWAGRFRTVRIAKGGSMFCYPENIAGELNRVFGRLRSLRFLRGLDPPGFASGAAHVLAELNAVHAFRDGNGRAQLSFMALIAARAGHPLTLERLDPDPFLSAMIASSRGDEGPLASRFPLLIGDPEPTLNPPSATAGS